MRFWDPRRAAAYRIVEDALVFYGPNKVRAVADHFFASVDSNGKTNDSMLRAKISLDDEQTVLLFTKLKSLNDSNRSMFESVKQELKKYSSTAGPSRE